MHRKDCQTDTMIKEVCITFKGGVSLLLAENMNVCKSIGKQEVIPSTKFS